MTPVLLVRFVRSGGIPVLRPTGGNPDTATSLHEGHGGHLHRHQHGDHSHPDDDGHHDHDHHHDQDSTTLSTDRAHSLPTPTTSRMERRVMSQGGPTTDEWTFAMIDLAGFTALTEAHGDHQAADLAIGFEELARERLGQGDRLVKPIGDAVLLASPSPASALRLVRSILEGCNALPDFPIARAGLHHGPAVERGTDMFGSAVNLTARVAGQAAGGQVLATSDVAVAARQADIPVRSVGTLALRNVLQPHELFDLQLCPSPSVVGIDPVCRMKVALDAAAGSLRHREQEYWFCSLDCASAFATDPNRYADA